MGAEKELNGLISVNPAHMMVLARTLFLNFKPSHTAESGWERSHGCLWAMASHSLNMGEERQMGVFGSCLEGTLVESHSCLYPTSWSTDVDGISPVYRAQGYRGPGREA